MLKVNIIQPINDIVIKQLNIGILICRTKQQRCAIAQTKFAKEDYAKQLQAKREALSKKEVELTNIKNRIGILESTIANRDLIVADLNERFVTGRIK